MTALAEVRSDGWVHDHRGCQSRAAHGTDAAWNHHLRTGDPICPPCRQAHTDYMASYRGGRYRDKLESARSIAVQLEQENAELLLMMAAAREVLGRSGGTLGREGTAALLYLLREPSVLS